MFDEDIYILKIIKNNKHAEKYEEYIKWFKA